MKKIFCKGLKGLGILILICFILILSVNFYVVGTTRKQIVDYSKIKEIENIDAILVLGAAVWGKEPSPMLEDRLIEAIALYQKNLAPKIIMSGDHDSEYYNEVKIMKNYAIEKGISSENIFMDHAGFSTYDSIYRAKEIFKVKKIIIVTQKYHLYRALYIAKSLGLEAYGIPSDAKSYAGQEKREIREILARDKDVLKCILKQKPKYLGEAIPISGDGNETNA